MRTALTVLLICIALAWGVTTCVDVANAYETKTLDYYGPGKGQRDELLRNYDRATGVVCYWNERHPAYINCVQVHPIGRNEIRSLKDGD